MEPSKPSLIKQPSNPISINPKATPTKSAGPQRMAKSMPVMKYIPPKAPTNRPIIPSCDPPPMEPLPPSPPIFTMADVQKELDKRAASQLMAAPSRSLNEYSLAKMLSTSAPAHSAWTMYPASNAPPFSSHMNAQSGFSQMVMPGSFIAGKSFTSSFDPVQENVAAEDDESDMKVGATSFSEPSTVFSMMKASSSASNPAPISMALSGSGSGGSTPDRSLHRAAHGMAAPGTSFNETGVEDVFQFSLSLDQSGESYMHDDEPEDSGRHNFSLPYRPH